MFIITIFYSAPAKKTAKAVKVKKATKKSAKAVKPAIKKVNISKRKDIKKAVKKAVKKIVKAEKKVKKTIKKTEKKANTLLKAKKAQLKKIIKKAVKTNAAQKKQFKKIIKAVKPSAKKLIKKAEKKIEKVKQQVKQLKPAVAVKHSDKPENKESEVLTQTEIKEIELRLIEMKKEVQERIRSKKEAEMPDTEVGDEADVASQNLDKEVLFELNGNAQVLLEQIESALRRISKGIYGTCEYCRCQIPKKRILAIPFARYCIKCQSSNERIKR